MLSKFWIECVEKVDHAFQPIINPFTGSCFAVEALIRNYDKCGFSSISDFFDAACEEKVLYELDYELRRKAIIKFMNVENYNKVKLFYNYDPRLAEMPGYVKGRTSCLLREYGLDPEMFCFEISERHKIGNDLNAEGLFASARKSGCKIALDDFGAGFANFELFYFSEPDYIKLDRFLISNLDRDIRKRKYCSHIVNLAHFFGIMVVAEGVETKGEFFAVKESGVDFVQGYFVQRPTQKANEINYVYNDIRSLIDSDRRGSTEDEVLIADQLEKIDAVSVNSMSTIVLEQLQEHPDIPVVPIVDSSNIPLGVISEKKLKKYLYLPYGKDLLHNKSINSTIRGFITKCPVVEINQPLEKILERFVVVEDTDGVIITKGLEYHGFLTAQSLLNTLNAKNLAYARDMNPLTKLPGNNPVNDYISRAFLESESHHYFIYFDFDNFKPFNDRFGFRRGDRAITLFADLLKKKFSSEGYFAGHIGGDDFFAAIRYRDDKFEETMALVKEVSDKFTSSVSSFYDKHEVEAGCYTSKDRYGNERQFDLLTVSAAVVCLPVGVKNKTPDEISGILAELKKQAKESPDKVACLCISSDEKYVKKINFDKLYLSGMIAT